MRRESTRDDWSEDGECDSFRDRNKAIESLWICLSGGSSNHNKQLLNDILLFFVFSISHTFL